MLALPLAFFLTAILFLAALLAVAIWQAPLLAQDYLHNTGTLALAGAWSSREAEAGPTVLFVLAWIGGTILGMLLRILPFMVWLHRFRNRDAQTGEGPVPARDVLSRPGRDGTSRAGSSAPP